MFKFGLLIIGIAIGINIGLVLPYDMNMIYVIPPAVYLVGIGLTIPRILGKK